MISETLYSEKLGNRPRQPFGAPAFSFPARPHIIKVSGNDVRGCIKVTTFNPRSKHVKPDNFSSTLQAWALAIRRATLQSSMRDQRPQKGCAAAAADTQRTYGASGGDAPQVQLPSPESCWWFPWQISRSLSTKETTHQLL